MKKITKNGKNEKKIKGFQKKVLLAIP